jgi:hypothetical protein
MLNYIIKETNNIEIRAELQLFSNLKKICLIILLLRIEETICTTTTLTEDKKGLE